MDLGGFGAACIPRIADHPMAKTLSSVAGLRMQLEQLCILFGRRKRTDPMRMRMRMDEFAKRGEAGRGGDERDV